MLDLQIATALPICFAFPIRFDQCGQLWHQWAGLAHIGWQCQEHGIFRPHLQHCFPNLCHSSANAQKPDIRDWPKGFTPC
jgi:hypothetical protein